MSDITRLKEQLHHVSTEAKQAAGGLGSFQNKFGQNSAQVQALIAGSATGADRQISEVLEAAGRAVGQAIDLQRVAQGLVECLDQIPHMVGYLQRLAVRCRAMASIVADSTASQSPRTAALQLDAAARACDEAAHYAAMAPPAARAWVEQMVSGGRTADRSTIGSRDVAGSNETRRPAPFLGKIMDRLPDRPNNTGPTRGILTRPDGNGQMDVISGKDGPGAGGPGLTGRTRYLSSATGPRSPERRP